MLGKGFLGAAVICVSCVFAVVGLTTAQAADHAMDYTIVLHAQVEDMVDVGQMTFGLDDLALEGWDALDGPHIPPLPSRFVDLYTEHSSSETGWEGQPLARTRYRREMFSHMDYFLGFTTDLVLETDHTGAVGITCDATAVPDYFAIKLTDLQGSGQIDFTRQETLTLSIASGTRALRIEVGPRGVEPSTSTPTRTHTPTITPTATHTATCTETCSPSPTIADTETPTETSTGTPSPSATETPSATPTATCTSTPTPQPQPWHCLFEISIDWQNEEYQGLYDHHQDGRLDELDLFEIIRGWHKEEKE